MKLVLHLALIWFETSITTRLFRFRKFEHQQSLLQTMMNNRLVRQRFCVRSWFWFIKSTLAENHVLISVKLELLLQLRKSYATL